MSDERINFITEFNYSINRKLSYFGNKIRVKFSRSCLKQDKTRYAHRKIVNTDIVYEINKNYNISSYQTLENCLFGVVSLTKSNNIDKYKYSGYGIGFDRKEKFSVGNRFGRKCIIFGVDKSSSVHVDNKKKDRNRETILKRAKDYYENNKDYYKNNKEVLREKARNKYRELSEKEKHIKR